MKAKMLAVPMGIFYAASALMLASLFIPSPFPVNLGLGEGASLPTALSVLILIPLYLWYRKASRSMPLRGFHGEPPTLALASALLPLALAMSVRVPFVVGFRLPLEKAPLVFLLILTITLAEGYSPSSFGFSSNKLVRHISLGLFLYLASQLLPFVALLGFASTASGQNPFRGYDPAPFLLAFPFMALAVGVAEEGLFRGYMQTKLSCVTGPRKAILIQAILFGLWHVVWHVNPFRPANMAFHVAATFVFGVLAGAYFRYTRNLISLALLHGLVNSAPAGAVVDFAPNLSPALLLAVQGSASIASVALLSLSARRLCGLFGVLSERPLGLR